MGRPGSALGSSPGAGWVWSLPPKATPGGRPHPLGTLLRLASDPRFQVPLGAGGREQLGFLLWEVFTAWSPPSPRPACEPRMSEILGIETPVFAVRD